MGEGDTVTFGGRLRWARLQRHLRQQQVAEACGQESHVTVGNWEKGRNLPSLENLVIAAELYQVSLDWLIWGGDMAKSIDARVRGVPKILRDGLIQRLHAEIDKTEEAIERLPAGLAGAAIPDTDRRLAPWSAATKRRAKAKPGGTQ